jgi:hypothetical protein
MTAGPDDDEDDDADEATDDDYGTAEAFADVLAG